MSPAEYAAILARAQAATSVENRERPTGFIAKMPSRNVAKRRELAKLPHINCLGIACQSQIRKNTRLR